MASRGVRTTLGDEKVASAYAGTLGPNNENARRMNFSFFRLGEGGVTTPGAGVRAPVDLPDKSFTDIQSISKKVYWTEKSFGVGDVVVVGTLCTITVQLDPGEGEAPNGIFPSAGGNPEYSECGIFDEAGQMILYFTFPPEEKTPASTLTRTFNINLAV